MSQSATSLAHRLTHRLESGFDRTWSRIKKTMGWLDPATIQPFRGYGDGERIRAKLRVLEESSLSRKRREGGQLAHLIDMFNRFETDEIPDARLKAEAGDGTIEIVSDEEGYADIAFDKLGGARPDASAWRDVSVELIEPYRDGQPRPLRVDLPVLVPSSHAEFAVVSDIDDTILKTGATNLLRNLRTTLLSSLDERSPFLGVSSFYQALQRGGGDFPCNPIFYVSSSPWNLYDFLEAFMDRHDIPVGPMFLKDLGLDENKVIKSGHGDHKLAAIQTLMDFYPDLGFILIGDSGQHDAEIYRDAVQNNPERVRAVYIRALDEAPERDEPAKALLREIEEKGVQTALCDDLILAAENAAQQGWIDPSAIDGIRTEVARERQKDG